MAAKGRLDGRSFYFVGCDPPIRFWNGIGLLREKFREVQYSAFVFPNLPVATEVAAGPVKRRGPDAPDGPFKRRVIEFAVRDHPFVVTVVTSIPCLHLNRRPWAFVRGAYSSLFFPILG